MNIIFRAAKVRLVRLASVRTIARHFIKDRRGVAAMEFALIAPVLILLFLGSVEVTGGLDVDRKLDRATYMIADLLSQEPAQTSKDSVEGIMNIGAATLLPYWRDTPKITVTAIDISSTSKATVAWSRREVNGVKSSPYAAKSATSLPSEMLVPSSSVIRVEMETAYIPIIAWTITGTVNPVNPEKGGQATGISLGHTAYSRMRRDTGITCSDCK